MIKVRSLTRLSSIAGCDLNLTTVLVCVAMPSLSLFSPVLEQAFGSATTVLTGAVVLAVILLNVKYLMRPIGGTWALLLMAFSALICACHCITGSSLSVELRWLLLMVMVFAAAPSISAKGTRALGVTTTILSVVICLDALLKVGTYASLGYGLYNVRADTLVDKPAYTLYITIALVFLLHELVSSGHKGRKAVAGAVAVLLIGVGVWIVESKTIIVACGVVVLLYLLTRDDKRTLFLIAALLIAGVVLLIGVSILFPHILPGSVKSAFYNILGISLGDYSPTLDATFGLRNEIASVAFEAGIDRPLLGLGFGGFESYSIPFHDTWGYAVTQTESSWLGFWAEGGLPYFFAQGVLNVLLIALLINRYRRGAGGYPLLAASFVAAYAALNVFNDFAYSTLYWTVLAVGLSHLGDEGALRKAKSSLAKGEVTRSCRA